MRRLKQLLEQIDGRGYKAYKSIQGTYTDGELTLFIDYVQGDPFASPSRIRLRVGRAASGMPEEWDASVHRRIALEDFLARVAARTIRQYQTRRGSGKSGMLAVDEPGQEILPRTAVKVTREYVELRMKVGLPAAGRRILGREAAEMLCEDVPSIGRQALFRASLEEKRLLDHLQLADDQAAIRQALKERGLVAFVANGSVLPRESGVSNRPLKGKVIPFVSPPSLEVTIDLPDGRTIKGMGIPEGITLIVGGGYHGKSTLLKAIERGVYNHIRGDGREYVITRERAMKIRAEDGRRVEKVDISPFINRLPFGQDTRQFSTEDASGSTSQAANIMEALEVGCDLLLMDEDTSATNFMIRDARMQALVAKEQEPITPFIDKVRQLYEERRVSTILVLGGSGDYLDVADRVIKMETYRPYDVTEEAKEIAARIPTHRRQEGGRHFGSPPKRMILPESFDARRGRKEKVDAKGLHTIVYGEETVDLGGLEQLVDPSQTRALAEVFRILEKQVANGQWSVAECIDWVEKQLHREGLDFLSPYRGQHPGDLAWPRRMEMAAAVNRLRSLRIRASER
ncbi:MAG: ATPase [Bacillus thermozeamaize]|uniref:ATPase n=1 Tax=Bacillus thermozeamaize TaxID=230954 RepID=A0A1Y3PFP0_9BACI|nr:MAG: ATPase [Bacillus thermozeamaize]